MFLLWQAGSHSGRTQGRLRPVPQAADKAGSVLVWVARPCWLSQGRGRSGGPRKRIFIPPHPRPCHSPRGAGCAPPSRPLPRLGGARAAVPCLGSLCLPVMDGRPAGGGCLGNPAVPKATRRPAYAYGAGGAGGRGAPPRISRPQPNAGSRGFRPLRAGASGPGFRGFVERSGGRGNWVYPAPLLQGAVGSHLRSRGAGPGRGFYRGRVWTRPWFEVAKFKPR